MKSRELCLELLVGLMATSVASSPTCSHAEVPLVDFQRVIKPILAEHCFKCHGQDSGARQAGLRLDEREPALVGGESGEKAIVPGKRSASSLVARINSHDADVVMPPPNENKPLSSEERSLIERWIDEGAKYTVHWAFSAPLEPNLPSSGPPHPIDKMVQAKLSSLGLRPSPQASNETLCRRLYLDLIGLPPTPREVDEFEKNGFEATVDMLLGSARFGEKWARHWLDVARYSDTNGYEKDLRREQWVWRDWVIAALNRDLPYDQFIIEQLAGDLLPGATQDQIIATGFLRNSMLNEEGAIVPEQFRMFEMFDRMDCIGKAVLGLTTQCAQCHSHKFDPLTQHEYYGMFAFLNNSYEALSWVYTPQQQRQIDEIQSAIGEVNDRIRAAYPNWKEELVQWEGDVRGRKASWTPLDAIELGSVSGLNHPVQLSDKSILMLGHVSSDVFVISTPDLNGVTGLRIEALNHGDLPHLGPGRSRLGTWAITEIEAFAQKPGSQDWEKLKFASATADFAQPDEKQSDGKKATGPVSYLIDGKDETAWQADRGIGRRNQPSVAVLALDKPLEFPNGTQLKIAIRMNDMLGCCRLSTTRSPNPLAAPIDYAAVLAMEAPAGERSKPQHDTLFTAWRTSLSDAKAWNEEIDQLWKKFPAAATTVMHLREREPDMHRPTHRLNRGEWDQPLAKVEPHTPAALHPFLVGEEPSRLSFARWLASEASPLTARVAVNRAWQAIFGEGLVETSEDFGSRAPVPEYLEILDWLAIDFVRNGARMKQLVKAIVSTETYRQSSSTPPILLERDPRNRLLARGPRFRVEAEVVRDIAMSVSGLMTDKLGGPPVIPPVPQNVLNYNYVVPNYWTAATGPERYRRTVYGFRKRSMPDPVMSSFDGPNGDMACARRVRSNTPLAALTSLNEPVFVEAAQAMALRILRDGSPDDPERAEYAFRLCTSRRPKANEISELLSLLNVQKQRIADGWLNPREIATGDPSRLPTLPPSATPRDAAAWTIVARVLLNLDETITKN